jgi:hypothetical protein
MRFVVVLSLILYASPALARSAGGGADGGEPSAGSSFDRDLFIGLSGIIETAFLGVHAGTLAFGKDTSRSVAGLQVALAAPCFIYGMNFVRDGGWDDPLVLGTTAMAGALIAHSIVVLARPRAIEPPRGLTVGPGTVGYALEF